MYATVVHSRRKRSIKLFRPLHYVFKCTLSQRSNIRQWGMNRHFRSFQREINSTIPQLRCQGFLLLHFSSNPSIRIKSHFVNVKCLPSVSKGSRSKEGKNDHNDEEKPYLENREGTTPTCLPVYNFMTGTSRRSSCVSISVPRPVSSRPSRRATSRNSKVAPRASTWQPGKSISEHTNGKSSEENTEGTEKMEDDSWIVLEGRETTHFVRWMVEFAGRRAHIKCCIIFWKSYVGKSSEMGKEVGNDWRGGIWKLRSAQRDKFVNRVKPVLNMTSQSLHEALCSCVETLRASVAWLNIRHQCFEASHS